MTTQTRTRRPRMTASEARSFDRYSIANAAHAEGSLGCGCQAYRDIFTYRRWQGLGFQVLRGQKAIKLPVIKNVDREKDDGEVEHRRIFGTSAVFCRHQVGAIDGETPAPVATPEPTPPAPVVRPEPVARAPQMDKAETTLQGWMEV